MDSTLKRRVDEAADRVNSARAMVREAATPDQRRFAEAMKELERASAEHAMLVRQLEALGEDS